MMILHRRDDGNAVFTCDVNTTLGGKLGRYLSKGPVASD